MGSYHLSTPTLLNITTFFKAINETIISPIPFKHMC